MYIYTHIRFQCWDVHIPQQGFMQPQKFILILVEGTHTHRFFFTKHHVHNQKDILSRIAKDTFEEKSLTNESTVNTTFSEWLLVVTL